MLWQGYIVVFVGSGKKVTEVIFAFNLKTATHTFDFHTAKFRYCAAAAVNEGISYITDGLSSKDSVETLQSSLNRYSRTRVIARYKYHTVTSLNCDVCPHFLRGKSRAGFFLTS